MELFLIQINYLSLFFFLMETISIIKGILFMKIILILFIYKSNNN